MHFRSIGKDISVKLKVKGRHWKERGPSEKS